MSSNKTTALVTGASAGIGTEFVRQLAERCDVIIATGRRQAQLEALAAELAGQVEMHTLAVDLTEREGLTRAIEMLRQKGPVDYLVNNAGFAHMGRFADVELSSQESMIALHIDATLALTRAALPFMREKGQGWIINLSSVASFVPMAAGAVYGASKEFLNHFSIALQKEEKAHGIKVQCLCPGYTYSEFHDREGLSGFERSMIPQELWQDAGEVVSASLAALADDAVVFIPGQHNLDMARDGVDGQLQRLGSS